MWALVTLVLKHQDKTNRLSSLHTLWSTLAVSPFYSQDSQRIVDICCVCFFPSRYLSAPATPWTDNQLAACFECASLWVLPLPTSLDNVDHALLETAFSCSFVLSSFLVFFVCCANKMQWCQGHFYDLGRNREGVPSIPVTPVNIHGLLTLMLCVTPDLTLGSKIQTSSVQRSPPNPSGTLALAWGQCGVGLLLWPTSIITEWLFSPEDLQTHPVTTPYKSVVLICFGVKILTMKSSHIPP